MGKGREEGIGEVCEGMSSLFGCEMMWVCRAQTKSAGSFPLIVCESATVL